MDNRIDAVYARQSVDKKDSISIESQIDFCKYELKGGSCLWKAVYYAKSIAKKPVFQEKAVDLLFIIQHDFIVTINRSRRE